jgi:hypothetical protein
VIGPDEPVDYPESVKECWAVHQALRTLGFKPDDIYVAAGQSAGHAFNPPAMFVVLRTQDKEFVVTLALFETDEAVESALQLWTEFAERWNADSFDQDVMDKIYNESNVMQNSAQLVLSIEGKGIRCPVTTN